MGLLMEFPMKDNENKSYYENKLQLTHTPSLQQGDIKYLRN